VPRCGGGASPIAVAVDISGGMGFCRTLSWFAEDSCGGLTSCGGVVADRTAIDAAGSLGNGVAFPSNASSTVAEVEENCGVGLHDFADSTTSRTRRTPGLSMSRGRRNRSHVSQFIAADGDVDGDGVPPSWRW